MVASLTPAAFSLRTSAGVNENVVLDPQEAPMMESWTSQML